MSLLAGIAYDPATQQSKATTAAGVMTAFEASATDLTFTAPTNGIVAWRVACANKGATTLPALLFGILNTSGSVVLARSAVMASRVASATHLYPCEAVGLITGLTGGNSYTVRPVYGIEFGVLSTNLVYGGPNNATSLDAAGALCCEIWDTEHLFGGKQYDPGTAVTKSLTTGQLSAMTAFDTTNLRITFTTEASGAGSTSVAWRIRCPHTATTGTPSVHFGVLDGSTVRARVPSIGAYQSYIATDIVQREASGVITGLTASTSYTFDAAYGVEGVATSAVLKYGGPDNTTASDAAGGITFDIWKA